MVKDNYPLPLIDDLLDRLVNKTIFSKLDLKHGYFHVFVDKESIKYTAFMTPFGQFEFLRMPMGLKNAPAVFQRFINRIFENMIRQDKVIIYMCFVGGRSFPQRYPGVVEISPGAIEVVEV